MSTILLALFPVLIYIGIIYLNSPYKSINLLTTLRYFLVGVLSIGILDIFTILAPGFFEQVADPFMMFGVPHDFFIYMCFIQIALSEELSKLLAFKLSDLNRDNSMDHPVATMFYAGVSALGFAVLENIHYAANFGDQILLVRSMSSMMLHFLTGLFLGYWVSLGRLNTKIQARSFFEFAMKKHPKLRKYIYLGIGLISAMFIHGLYNYNLFIGGESSYVIMFLILTGGLLAAYIGYKDLLTKWRNHLNKPKSKEN